jgi:hypothetical protein
MFTPSDYLAFAQAADQSAHNATTTELRAHYSSMAAAWRDLIRYTARTEACRPGGPCVD